MACSKIPMSNQYVSDFLFSSHSSAIFFKLPCNAIVIDSPCKKGEKDQKRLATRKACHLMYGPGPKIKGLRLCPCHLVIYVQRPMEQLNYDCPCHFGKWLQAETQQSNYNGCSQLQQLIKNSEIHETQTQRTVQLYMCVCQQNKCV